jgi:hypothetical protein
VLFIEKKGQHETYCILKSVPKVKGFWE